MKESKNAKALRIDKLEARIVKLEYRLNAMYQYQWDQAAKEVTDEDIKKYLAEEEEVFHRFKKSSEAQAKIDVINGILRGRGVIE